MSSQDSCERGMKLLLILVKMTVYMQIRIPPAPPRISPYSQTSFDKKGPSYFLRQPLDNILIWQRHIEIILNPTLVPQKGKITQHFKQPQPPRSRKRKQTIQMATPKKKKKNKNNCTITNIYVVHVTITYSRPHS